MLRKRVTCAAAAFAALVSVAALAGTASTGAAEEPADALVYDAITAPSTVSYEGTVEITQIGRNGSVSSRYTIEHKAPDLTRRLYSRPASVAGDSVITRGGRSYSVDVRRKRIVVSSNRAVGDEVAFDDNYILLRQNYAARETGSEGFDGRDCDVVELINNYTKKPAMRVHIDRATHLVLAKEQFGADGSLVSQERFISVMYAPQIRDDDFKTPVDYPVVRGSSLGLPSHHVDRVMQRAGFAAHGPTFLPEGFTPVTGNVIDIEGVRTLHLLYSDGIRTVSLFEDANAGAAVRMTRLHPQDTQLGTRQAQYAAIGPTTLLAWTDGALHYRLVGDLRLDELKKIAASIAP